MSAQRLYRKGRVYWLSLLPWAVLATVFSPVSSQWGEAEVRCSSQVSTAEGTLYVAPHYTSTKCNVAPCLPVRDRTQTGGRISVSFPSSKSELHSDGILETVESPRGEHTDPADTCSPSEGDGALPLRRLPNNAFRVGERLVFSVEYGPFKAGQATMEVLEIEEVNGRRCYHLISEARTSELFSSFFEVRDRVESYMDVDGLFPWRFEKHLREGRFRSDMRVEYGQVNHVAVTDKDTMKVPPFVQDILSGFYYGRLQELKRGESIFIDHHSGRKIYPLEVKVLKRERVKVPAGVFKCMVIEPVLQAVGIFKHAGRLRVWLTDDERKIPVLMKSKMIIGSVAAKLVEYDLGGEE